MERETEEKDQATPRQSSDWYARVAADVRAHRAEQHRLYGGIDEMMCARYEAGACTDEEKVTIERAMRDHPELRKRMETDRELFAEWQASASPRIGERQPQGDESWTRHVDQPEPPSGKLDRS
jgi:hypothetical protein